MHRRQFLKAAAVTMAGPAMVGATNKSGLRNPIFKAGDRSYECLHDCFQLPSHLQWQTSHGICFDAAGHAYVIMMGLGRTPVDTIHVFDSKGQYVRSFGKEFHPGGHGIDVRKEGSEEFLYVCDMAHNQVVKISLRGEPVWKLDLPQEAKVYTGNKKYKPTNVAFAADGGFFIGDGYGSHYIHQYTADAKYVKTFGGGGGAALGQLKTPHGLWFDPRPGRQGLLAIADRENGRIVYHAPSGEAIGVVPGFERPCNVDYHDELCVVPELNCRVTLLGKNNEVLARFGEEPGWKEEVAKKKLRNDPKAWPAGRFIHPHDATFDRQGNIYVVEWVETGRITKLRLM
jgi:hypothetical protein